MRVRIAAIIIGILLLAPAQQDTFGCAVASSNIAAALTSAPTCLDIPAGVYDIPSTINTGASIHGAGIGKTILRATGATYIFKLIGNRQTISDLSLTAPVTATSGIAVTGGMSSTLERIEVSGAFTAAGLETYQSAAAPVQWGTIRDCFIHDLLGNGLLIDSSRNLITGNRIERVGTTGLYHGIYMQGGDNRIVGNTIMSASGYSLHNWDYVPNLDGTGNVYEGNLSINPGLGHMVIGGVTRQTTIAGNTFRNTNGSQSGGIDARAPVIVQANTFEDVTREGYAIIGISQAASGSVVSNNRITTKLAQPGYGARFGILLDAPALVSGNTIDMASLPWGIVVRVPRGQIIGNRVTSTVGYAWQMGIKVDAPDTIVSQNLVDLPLGVAIGGTTPPAMGLNLCWVASVARGC